MEVINDLKNLKGEKPIESDPIDPLREGHLDYGDYQKWRKGKSAFLEDHFKTPITEIIADLQRMQDYATALKLESFSHHTHQLPVSHCTLADPRQTNLFLQPFMSLLKTGCKRICFLTARLPALLMT